MKRTTLGWATTVALAFLTLARGAEKEAKPAHTLTAIAERSGAIYQRGETVTFLLTLEEHGKPADGEVDWTLTKDGVAPTRSGKVAVKGGKASVTGSLAEPGFLQLRATVPSGAQKVTALAGAGIEPTAIAPSAPAPADFDAFWAEQKRQLAAVPMNPRLTATKSATANVEVFDLQLAALGAPVSGYFARPAKAAARSLPAILTVHGAGVRSASATGPAGWARDGALALDINAHGIPNGKPSAFYEALAAGELKDYRAKGRESRDTIYFKGMMLRLVRAIDFLAAQPEWDGRTLVVYGSSQGGFQAIVAAGLDPRVSFLAAGVPAGCDHTGALVGRIAGWPKFIATNEQKPAPAVVEAVKYYDGVNFAARAKVPAIFTVGFIDTTCPPTSVYAAYNALREPKEIFHDIKAGHTNTPAARDAMNAAVKRHLAANRAN
jgi:cephalosporin-C deacetylase-like acetyl esterase